jgi:hypothetical protein
MTLIALEVSRLRSNSEKEEEQLNFFTCWCFRNDQLAKFRQLPRHDCLLEINKSRAAKRILIGLLKYS